LFGYTYGNCNISFLAVALAVAIEPFALDVIQVFFLFNFWSKNIKISLYMRINNIDFQFFNDTHHMM
jgi:hypothetical protein